MNKLQQINKLAEEIMNNIDGLLESEEPEPTIFRKAKEISKLSKEINKR